MIRKLDYSLILLILIIDLSVFGIDDSEASTYRHSSERILELEQHKAMVAKHMYEALSVIGFVFIKNHGCPEAIINQKCIREYESVF